MRSIILVDGNPLLWRAVYHKDESYVCEGIINYFFKILSRFPESDALLFWDSGKSRWRNNLYTKYKENRDAKKKEVDLNEISDQKKEARRILRYFGVRQLAVQNVEADDLISFFSEYFSEILRYDQVIIASRDKDLWQLINDKVIIHDPLSNKTINKINILEEIGITADQVPDWKSLVGDVSDNIPGVKGIGEKAATKYINELSGITGLLDLDNAKELKKAKTSSKILDQSEDLLTYYQMVKLPRLKEMKYFMSEVEISELTAQISEPIVSDTFRADVEISAFESSANICKRFVSSLDNEVKGISEYLVKPMENYTEIQQLDQSIGTCEKCSLRKLGQEDRPMYGEGFSNSKYVIIYGAISKEQRLEGRHEAGKVGEKINEFLKGLEIPKEKCWVTSACKCYSEKPLVIGEILACMNYLKAEIELVKPKMVIIFGNEALNLVSDCYVGASKLSGSVFERNIGKVNCYVGIMPNIQYSIRSSWGSTEFEYGMKKIKEFLDSKRKV